MARLTHHSSNELARVSTKSARFVPPLLLCSVLRRKAFPVARLAVTVIATLGLGVRFATSRLVETTALRHNLDGTSSTHQRPTQNDIERQPEHAENRHEYRLSSATRPTSDRKGRSQRGGERKWYRKWIGCDLTRDDLGNGVPEHAPRQPDAAT